MDKISSTMWCVRSFFNGDIRLPSKPSGMTGREAKCAACSCMYLDALKMFWVGKKY
jgi:hypothetical protein